MVGALTNMAKDEISTLFDALKLAAFSHAVFRADEAGCQDGGPEFVKRPIDSGAAAIR